MMTLAESAFTRTLRVLLYPWIGARRNFRMIFGTLESMLTELRVLHNVSVNRELGPEGRIAKAGLWFNPPIAVQMGNDRPTVVMVTERILERIFVFTRLPRPPARVLDLGCAESTTSIEMASLGFDVTGVDLRPLPLSHPRFQMVRANIACLPLPADSFDVAVALSTIEHVGRGWYASFSPDENDHRVATEVFQVLRPGGLFILTVPFGQATITPVHRVYDRAQLDELLRSFRRLETAFGVREGETWIYTTDHSRVEHAPSTERVSAVALVVAEKPA